MAETAFERAVEAVKAVQGFSYLSPNRAEQIVRAVLGAVREPDLDMALAAVNLWEPSRPIAADAEQMECAAETWQAMIDALTSPGEGG